MKIRHPKLFLVCLALMQGVSTFQFAKDYSKYTKLKKTGVVAETNAEFIPGKITVDYYTFSFSTTDGQVITETGKCGDRERFDEFYSDLKVVYDPEDPNEYLEKPYFDHYSLGYKIIFYFGLYGLIGSVILYRLLSMIKVLSDKESIVKIRKS